MRRRMDAEITIQITPEIPTVTQSHKAADDAPRPTPHPTSIPTILETLMFAFGLGRSWAFSSQYLPPYLSSVLSP